MGSSRYMITWWRISSLSGWGNRTLFLKGSIIPSLNLMAWPCFWYPGDCILVFSLDFATNSKLHLVLLLTPPHHKVYWIKDKAQKQGLLYPAWIHYTTLFCSRADSKLPAPCVTWYGGISVGNCCLESPKWSAELAAFFVVRDTRCSHLLPWKEYSSYSWPLKTSYRSNSFGFSSYFVHSMIIMHPSF